MSKVQNWTLTALATATLVVGILLATGALSFAQEGDDSTPTPTPTPTATAEATDDATATPSGDESTDSDNSSDNAQVDSGCVGGGPFRQYVEVKAAAAEVLGISEDDLQSALDDGQTLAEVAEAQGMSADDFQAALADNITADLQAKLDAGEITQEEYDHIAGELDDHLDVIINAEGGFGFPGRHGYRHHLDVLDVAAEVLGLDEVDVRDALIDGQTLAEVAEAQGMSVDDFKAALVENITADLQSELDESDITQDEFDNITEDLDEKVDDIINAEGGMSFGGPHRGFGGGAGFPAPLEPVPFGDGT